MGCFNVRDRDLPRSDLGAVKVPREAVHSLAGMSIGLMDGVPLPQRWETQQPHLCALFLATRRHQMGNAKPRGYFCLQLPAMICAGDGIACSRKYACGNGHDTMIGRRSLAPQYGDSSPTPFCHVRHKLRSSAVPLLWRCRNILSVSTALGRVHRRVWMVGKERCLL